MRKIHILGGGLAGSEAALAAAQLGAQVLLHEMRPQKQTPAHKTDKLAELVCSNSLGGESASNAKGLLQAEMRVANSIVMRAADEGRVPAGGALAVEREIFSAKITAAIESHPRIALVRNEVLEIPAGEIVVLATGPLTSEALSNSLRSLIGDHFLSFYDAAAPIVHGESIDPEICYRAGRYDQPADYWNCPMSREQYEIFYEKLANARKHTPHDWEHLEFFEGCMPIEEIARRGFQSPLFGPMKPRGLRDPKTGREPFAVVQLRAEDRAERLWGLVGFQTGLKWPDQKEIVQSIPGLQNAEIVRYGVMHRNTYLNAPRLLHPTLELREHPGIFVAGVLAGVEGYLESAATGWLAGTNAARKLLGDDAIVPPEETMLGSLVRFLSSSTSQNFQPMNANWGLVPCAEQKMGKKEKREAMFYRGLASFRSWLEESSPAKQTAS